MKIIKTKLHNKMSDAWLNDLMVSYIEREIFKRIDLEKIKNAFQKKKDRKVQLPRSLHCYSVSLDYTCTFLVFFFNVRFLLLFVYFMLDE
jgi:hypothetical protein